jgi:hypothetical protein
MANEKKNKDEKEFLKVQVKLEKRNTYSNSSLIVKIHYIQDLTLRETQHMIKMESLSNIKEK